MLVALCFGTATAPYVVKNPLYGTAGHVIASEVPWRDGTRVRSVHKHELKALLLPRLALPEIMIHSAPLTLHIMKDGNTSAARWSGQMV